MFRWLPPSPPVRPLKAGKLRALATWGATRHPVLPGIPTLKELGIDAEFYIWAGLLATAGTPEPVSRQLREAVRQSVNDPQFKRSMESAGQPIRYLDAPEFKPFLDKDARKMAEVVKAIGRVEAKK